jgi:hypothetical protein
VPYRQVIEEGGKVPRQLGLLATPLGDARLDVDAPAVLAHDEFHLAARTRDELSKQRLRQPELLGAGGAGHDQRHGEDPRSLIHCVVPCRTARLNV